MMIDDNQHPDEEIRALAAYTKALSVARTLLLEVADARNRRGADIDEQLDGQDVLLAQEHGATRALLRRKRDVGTLLVNPHGMVRP